MDNTIEAALKQWKEREQRYEKLFSPSVLKSKEFLREKLKHYDQLRAKVIAGSNSGSDRLALRALELERKQLARQVYPNIIIRLLERMVSAFKLDKDVLITKVDAVRNNENVREAMARSGLGSYYNQVEQQLKQGNSEFTIPVSYQVSETERMDLQLTFKGNDEGIVRFDGYKATLYNELEKGKSKQYTFSNETSTTVNKEQAYNLLSGRAIQQKNSDVWQQIDLNDKDANGNYRMRNFPQDYGFNLEKTLAALQLKEQDASGLMEKLKSGYKAEVVMVVNGKEQVRHIEANPIKKKSPSMKIIKLISLQIR